MHHDDKRGFSNRSEEAINPYAPHVRAIVRGCRSNEMPIPAPEPAGLNIDLKDGFGKIQKAKISCPCTRKERTAPFRKLPFCAVPGYSPICLDANDPNTVNDGIKKRLLRADLPDYDLKLLSELRQFVRGYVHKHYQPIAVPTFEEWLATTGYNEQRKEQLRAAHDDLRGGAPNRKQRRSVSVFVKVESYTEYKHCRWIMSRSDPFKVYSGPIFKAIEQQVYQDHAFIKHVPVQDRPAMVKALKLAGMHYFATDFTAFESHFRKLIMESIEFELYSYMLQNYPVQRTLILKTLSGINSLHNRMGTHVLVEARRMSGEMCTSLGNGFTNWMLASFLVHKKGGEITGFVEGDDGLFATNVVLTTEDYKKLGFTIKIEEVVDPCLASFCGLVFSDNGEIVRDPRKFLQTFGWTSSFTGAGDKVLNELLLAKSMSALTETPQCPIVAVLARYGYERTKHLNPRFVSDGYHENVRFSESVFNPSADTRRIFAQLYGISEETQHLCEEAIVNGDFGVIQDLIKPNDHVCHFAARYIEVTR